MITSALFSIILFFQQLSTVYFPNYTQFSPDYPPFIHSSQHKHPEQAVVDTSSFGAPMPYRCHCEDLALKISQEYSFNFTAQILLILLHIYREQREDYANALLLRPEQSGSKHVDVNGRHNAMKKPVLFKSKMTLSGSLCTMCMDDL